MACGSEYENRNCNEDDRRQFQDAVPLGSPVEETQLCNPDFDTELLYDSDCGGDGKMTELPCEYEEEMVLDSEDEEINGSRLVTVTKSLPDNEAENRPEQLCAGHTHYIFLYGRLSISILLFRFQ